MTSPQGGMRTSYEFTLPRGYVGPDGRVHRNGAMRLATARDELEPLRNPSVSGPDDPRLTVLVLGRVVESLGDLSMVTDHEIEGLFAVDLAFLQDFYGVINFGTQEEYEALLQAQQGSTLVGSVAPAAAVTPQQVDEPEPDGPGQPAVRSTTTYARTGRVEEVPRTGE